MRNADSGPIDTLVASLAASALSLLAVAALAAVALAVGDGDRNTPATTQACHCALDRDDAAQPAER